MFAPWKESYDKSRQHIKKQRHHFANKGPHSQSYGFSSESESEVTQSCPTLCDPMDYSLSGSLSIGFSRQEYWNGLPFPSPGGLPDPGIEPRFPAM